MDKKSKLNRANMDTDFKLSFLATLIVALLTVTAFFLPLASANDEYEKYLKEYAQEFNVEEIEMTNEDAVHVSMYEFVKIYWATYSFVDATLGIVGITVSGAVGVLSLITLLFTLLRKPIAVFVFDLLTFGAYCLLIWDFKDRGVVPGSHYDWGIAYYLYFISLFLVLLGAAWMFWIKANMKKRLNHR